MARRATAPPSPAGSASTGSVARSSARSGRSSPISCNCGSRTAPAMREPGFWWRGDGAAARLLAPAGAAYGLAAAWRMAQPGRQAAVPVLCVGNFTVGGSGKTPTAIAVARLLTEAGRRPFFLSRGYGGALAGPVHVDAQPAAAVGDEPRLLARVAPTIVAHDRPAGARAAI